jgi:hypothetical protein
MWTLNPLQAKPPVLNDKRREEKCANAHIHLLPKPSPQYSMVKQGRRSAPTHTYISSQSQAPSPQCSMMKKAFSKEMAERKTYLRSIGASIVYQNN